MMFGDLSALLFSFLVTVGGELRVRNSGIEHIDRLDVGMVFSTAGQSFAGIIEAVSTPGTSGFASRDHDNHEEAAASITTHTECQQENPDSSEECPGRPVQCYNTQSEHAADFLEIENEGEHPTALSTRMIDCCENITPEDIDCEHIQLIGGDMGILNPRSIRNLTLVWPTLYLHERNGECNVAITYRCRDNQTGEIQHKVRFDTSVSGRNVPAILEGYYEPVFVKRCASVDLDPLDHCRPTNCHIKYNGRRNFYNRKLQRCQSVPICIADTGKELPNVAYVPASNTCRDLENAVNEMEIQALSRGEAEPAWGSEPAPRMLNMYCHHGYNDNVTGFCICDGGWTSQPLRNLEPSNEYIHMCNVQTSRFPKLNGNPVEVVLFVIAGLLGTLVVLFCCAMTFLMRGFMPPGPTVERGQQTGGLGYFDSSAKSYTTCSSIKNTQKPCRSSTVSCPGLH